jgi:hypothetical protein
MRDLETALEKARPTIELPNYQRNLRRELLKAAAHSTPQRGYRLAMVAVGSCALLFAALLILFVARPQLPTRLNAALMNEPSPTLLANEPALSGPNEAVRGAQLAASDDMVLRDLLSDDRLSVDTDRALVDRWMAQRFPGKVQAQPVGNNGLLTVRQFRTESGQRILVYTQLSEEPETALAY